MKTTKIILITGASSGIGKTTAKRLIQEGHVVYAAARRLDQMEDLKEMGAVTIGMDITKTEDINRVVETIVKDYKRIDVLVNNAGYAIYGAVEETSMDDARRQFDVNIFGLAELTKMVIPMMRNNNSGTIINISSMGGQMYTPLGSWYHATKYALEGWSDCLRLELKQFGINVVIVEPGVIATEFGDVLMDPMMERSGNGPYAKIARALKKATTDSYNEGGGSSPEVIARVIAKAVNSKKPKSRYVAGKLAKPMMMTRKWLGTGIFDKIIMSQVK
ncbi:MAG TPA: oxidoreductase [Fulvivirga sp.]|nr:oxidoreductase [Fulvivirga sp.]